MTLAEIREWLKTKITCPNWYVGKIDAKKEQCIGLYSKGGTAPLIALGGLSNSSYSAKPVSILVHWGKNADEAEKKAQEIYAAMFGQGATIGNKRVINFDMRTPEPVGVGTDEQSIYEFVIEVNIFYER